ncbi:TIGR03013 family XrtA/PEP-CTERM system glycosyltransferase [Aestuariispira insulae]|uniref:Sugar transferase (PEP-CTERM system associated)/exopolysaccharide biosynthesis polyprenyl glycosylphosphotransferase n=1 Tax=Aestuariispira insulae TaxID=1461337 RepID=A0A3D9HK50_9PROT|nr:TIGR03013 family XrtA/PEP-CTERM system glycosyltransferase [Aestuariispira insulae]RED49887.1 sugar transferase (PEP-CTERM system associated)/exopolysaccharide biosynthesis polyprenyl glycosylphosphotransferase [Aestuariispira insulae]
MMVRVFRHHISLYAILLAFSEMALFSVAAFFMANITLRDPGLDTGDIDLNILVASLALSVFVTVCSIGFYSRRVTMRGGFRATQWVAAFLIVSVVLGVVFLVHWWLFSPDLRFPLTGWGAAVGIYALAAVMVRVVFDRLMRDRKVLRKRVLVLGTGSQAEKIYQVARTDDQKLFELVGFLSFGRSEERCDVQPVLSDNLRTDRYALADFASANDVDEIVVTLRDRRRPEGKLGDGLPIWEMMDCKLRGIQVTEFANFWERELGKVDLKTIRPSWIIFSDGFRVSMGKRVVKRIFDIAVSAMFVLTVLPIMLLTMIAIKLDSRGPIFYSQERVGLDGRTFSVLKFRSMRTDAEAKGAQWASKNDDRVTRVGRFIRKTRIDEIPQILNVLKGEMSFVGPRPERPVFVNDLDEKVPFYRERHRIKPGITGWAQINYPYGATLEDAHEKHAFDLYYLKNIGFFLDIVILIQTVRVVLFGEGAR